MRHITVETFPFTMTRSRCWSISIIFWGQRWVCNWWGKCGAKGDGAIAPGLGILQPGLGKWKISKTNKQARNCGLLIYLSRSLVLMLVSFLARCVWFVKFNAIHARVGFGSSLESDDEPRIKASPGFVGMWETSISGLVLSSGGQKQRSDC